MDNLTHSLTGLMLSRAGLDKLTPRAPWVLLIAANMPDVDTISGLAGAEAYFRFHRWYTHALILTPVMALFPVIVVRLLFRQKLQYLRAWFISFLGVLSHLLLDSTNPYGIRLLLPWSDAWPRLDITSVVDIWIWIVLLLAVSAPAISRLVSWEIGAAKTKGRGWAVFALAFILCYDTGRYFLHQRVLEVQRGRVYEGLAPRRVVAFPTSINPLHWQGFVETEDFWAANSVNLLREFDPTAARLFFKAEVTPEIEAAGQTPLFRDFLGFSSTPLCSSNPAEDPPENKEVECHDLRFGFGAHASVDQGGRVQRTWFTF